MINRLPGSPGSRIDAMTTIRFSFEGRSYQGLAGDTIASALAANDVWVLSRSFKYHRPRGILSLAGHDANTLVQLPDEPNVCADLRPIAEGLEVRAQNVNGTLARDRGALVGWFGRFLRPGFYYAAFYKPRGAWRYWEPIIRNQAGLGRLNLEAVEHRHSDKQFLFFDVAVVGGGPAGMSAALEAAAHGASVLLVEEHPALGGALNFARFDVPGRSAGAARARLAAAVAREPRVRVLTSATCSGVFADNWLAVVQADRLFKVRARRLIVATGGIEQMAVFRNNDLPGILCSTAAQRLIREFGVRPGRNAVVATGTDYGYAVALDLKHAGVNVVGIVDFRKSSAAEPCAEEVRRLAIPVYQGYGIVEAQATRDKNHIAGIVAAPSGQGVQPRTMLSCDLLAVAPGWMPAFQLAAQAGGRLQADATGAAFVPLGLPDNADVAGSVRGCTALDAVIADGKRAGWRAARALQFDCGDEPPPVAEETGPVFAHPVFRHKQGKEFVDFDEDLQVGDLEYTCALGYADIELVKRFSTLGMGPSQGRLSALGAARVVAEATGHSMDVVNVTTARPPFVGETLATLAGTRFDPVRQTPMHYRHLEAGAQMVAAGRWLRPAYYATPEAKERAVAAEAAKVRASVGLIDVSTLGGFEIRGPDAAEFLDRIYTSSFKQLRVGMSRYALMCNDMGTVIDDGVIARFREHHFYVTTTTTGADAQYPKMLWWNAQWRLNVDIANVTAAYGAVNIAGPDARAVLQMLSPGLDLSAAAFPYLAAREARVAGVPVRMLRVGFVGELGYELHAPAGESEALWDALIEAGRRYGIAPFGVDAQRLLRLEKGHVIIGQDTDGLSTPEEIGAGWAVRDDKPFFVGQRALRIIGAQAPARRVVGFVLELSGPMPEEGNLILQNDGISGYVSSIGRSQAARACIGMALVHAGQSQLGTLLEIQQSDGSRTRAKVVKLPFYDPDAKRQLL